MQKELKTKLWPLSLSAIAILLDQITKAIVVKNIPLYTPFSGDDAVIPVIGNFLRLIHVRNPAVAFSLGASLPDNARSILFSFIPLIVVALIYFFYFKTNDLTKTQRWALCGILGGGLGNLIDRFFRPEGVVDFIDCIWFGNHSSKLSFFRWDRWPTFNVADSFVVVCVIILIVTFIVQAVLESKTNKGKKAKWTRTFTLFFLQLFQQF